MILKRDSGFRVLAATLGEIRPMLTRRDLLIAGSAALVARPSFAMDELMPSLFYGHGGPPLAVDEKRRNELGEMADLLPYKPRAIIAFTPHVRQRWISIATQGIARWSFPRRFRKMVKDIGYHPPAAPQILTDKVFGALQNAHVDFVRQQHKAYNHTIWMGLLHLFPQADVPVIEIAMPFLEPARLFAIGQALAPLRKQGVLVVSSGTVTHNLGSFGHTGPVPSWASEFDHWTKESIAGNQIDHLIDWRNKGPANNIAHPDDGGHFNVLMFALGAAVGAGNGLSWSKTMHEHYEFGTFSDRGFLLN